MEWIAVVVALVIGALIGVSVPLFQKLKQASSPIDDYPYRKNDRIFTAAERSFLGVLEDMLGQHYRILGKVRIADVVSVEGCKEGQWQRQRDFISSDHFDFLLCSKEDFSAVAAIELEKRSKNRSEQRQRDDFISGVCDAASLRLIRIPARQVYTRSDVRRLVVNALNPPGEASGSVQSPRKASRKQLVPAAHSPACPKCASTMILRKIKRGTLAGEKIWGCRHYPECRGVVPLRQQAVASI